MKIKTIKTVLGHPLNQDRKLTALLTLFKRGLVIRLHPHPIVYPFIESTSLVVEKGMSSAELQIYTGLYDTSEMLFLMHFLRPDDTFADVGANVGVYTILASGVAGARSISFEPIPSTFANLKRNVVYNKLEEKVQLMNMGVGDKKETLVFSNSLDAINHVIIEPGYPGPTMEVPVNSLDDILSTETVNFLKIDVEGFEANVINGASQTLRNPGLKVIVMETNGLSNKYEFGENYIHNKLISEGFAPYSYHPSQRKIQPLAEISSNNTIYIRDLAFVENRVRTARKINLQGKLV